MISVIELVLALLNIVLAQAGVKGLPAEIVTDVEAAVAALNRVRGSEVTFGQLEGLRIQPKW